MFQPPNKQTNENAKETKKAASFPQSGGGEDYTETLSVFKGVMMWVEHLLAACGEGCVFNVLSGLLT